jgi:glycosyltransferase involved in cell wall biosynthesis
MYRRSKITNQRINISAVVIAKNEEEKISGCLKSLSWADEKLVIDNGSTDKTADVAQKLGAKVVYSPIGSYKESRDKGMTKSKGKWVLYVDADERATDQLRIEIGNALQKESGDYSAYAIPRRNIILGKELRHGGWWPDYVIHFLKKSKFIGWKGDLHEEPVFNGNLGYFKNPLIHLKHDNLSDMVSKTNTWSLVEATLMLKAGHPPMDIPRFISALVREFWLRMIKNKAYLDGTQGIIYALYQVFSRFLSYARLWELQLTKEGGVSMTGSNNT